MNYCGIFSRSQEGSEGQRQIQGDLPSQGEIQYQRDVPLFRRLSQRLLWVCETNGDAGKGSAAGREDPSVSDGMQEHLRLPSSADMVGETRNPSRS